MDGEGLDSDSELVNFQVRRRAYADEHQIEGVELLAARQTI